MKSNQRIVFASSHVFIFILSMVSALLFILKVPNTFNANQIFSENIHFSDTVFDVVTRLFLLGICSLYTTVASFWSFRSWPYLSAGIGIAAVITAFQMKVQFHPFLFALFLIVGLFQVSVASYVAFVSKKRSSTETIVFKLFFFCLKSFDYKQRIEIQRIRNRNCSIPAIAKAFTLRDL